MMDPSSPSQTERDSRLRILDARISSWERQRRAATWVSLVAACVGFIVFFTSIGGEQRLLMLALLTPLSVLMWAVSLLLELVMDKARREMLDLWWQERESR